MAGRRALLIGVPRYDDGEFTEIGDVVRSDVQNMHDTLEQSGYESVISFGIAENGQEPTGSRIKAQIKRACADAPPGGVLLLYFSGHGITIDGQDYLVPSDAYRDQGAPKPDPDSLVPLVPVNLEHCRAKLVVYFVDACRDDPAEPREPTERGGMLPYLANGDFVVVTGCRAGQRCLHSESGSFFTQALTQALDRRNPARTLAQVLGDVNRQMARRAARTEGLHQELEAHHQGTALPAATTVVCDGDQLTEAWLRAVETTTLWQHCDSDPHPAADMRGRVRAVIEECARHYGAAQEDLRKKTGIEDHWGDQNYPVRVLDHVSLLLGPSAELALPEVAALITAPFLRERVLAEGTRMAAGIDPANFARTYRTGARNDLETTHEMYQHIVRRAEGMESRGDQKARDTLAMWLVHQWLADRLSIWRSPAAQHAYDRGARLLDGCALPAAPRELPRLMEVLVRGVGADPVDHQLTEQLQRVYVDDRWRGLAALLWVAGILAADPRRMPPVIADHIGTRLELPLTAVTAAADRLEWKRKGDNLDLQMICDHPALHLALEDVAGRAGVTLTTVRDLLTLGALGNGLPERVTTHGLRPEQQKDDTQAYQTPIARFRLSEDKVRELLMGRQLYDDPALAIRELYQNALDACRYRRTRTEFLRRKGKSAPPWQGRIFFRQGVDDGRAYVECEDNGIGMDTDTLKHVFANAGERFVYRHEYRAEQAEWQDLQPPLRLVSNSQFGVGVFSYFMLADEITVVTRPVGRNGIASPDAYSVHIASSGSLFQITPSDGMADGGTRVRMYLTGDENISVLRTLRALLWIAEYRVEAAEENSTPEVWEAGELRYQDEEVESLKCDEDLWWVSGEGGLAADGIRTNEEIFGLIVNLRDTRRPKFTVDRKTLREWDREWVNEAIARSLPSLMSWPGLTLSWLWKLTESAPQVAQLVFQHLVSVGLPIPAGGFWGSGTHVPVDALGCSPSDWDLFDPGKTGYIYGRWFAAWRAGQWARLIGSRSSARHTRAVNTCAEGFPTVDPADAEMLSKINHLSSDAPVDIDAILKAVWHTDETVAARLKRLRRYAITGLDISACRDIPRLARSFKKEDQPLLRALATWARPGTAPRRNVAGWLVKASNKLDQPLGEVLRRVADVMPPGWTPPAIDLGSLTGYTCTAADAILVSKDIDGYPPWIDADIAPWRVIRKSAALGRSVEQILAMCDRLAPLGVAVAGREKYPADLNALEIEALRHLQTIGQHLTPIHLAVIAARTETSVQDAHAGLTRLEGNGVLVLCDISNLPEVIPSRDELELIETQLMVYRPSSQGFVLETGHSSAREIVWIVTAPRFCGSRELARAQRLVPFTAPIGPMTSMDLVHLANSFEGAVSEARERVRQVYPDAELPAITADEEALVPTQEITNTLVGPRWPTRKILTWLIGPGDIVAGATEAGQSLGAFLATLDPYRRLGAPVPDPDEAVRRELDELFPDEYDADMLRFYDKDENSYFPVSVVSPLFLVQVAGRYGWTVAATHRRMSRLVPLGLTLKYPADACPDDIVHWQDLLVVTRFLDGQEPAVQGMVSETHIAEAAAEFDEPSERVRERLRRYGPLFGFHLNEEITIDQ